MAVIRTLFYYWRVVATGLSFTFFYLCGLIVSFTVVPIIGVISSSETERHERTQTIHYYWFRTFAGFMQFVGVVKGINVTKKFDLSRDGPYVMVANHPTLIDVVAVVSNFKRVDCVVKMGVWNSWAMGGVVQSAGYIPDRSALSVYDTCLERLEEGRNILFFPEGTRSPKNGLRKFSKVASQVVLGSDAELVPIVIDCNVSTLRKDQNWYQVPPEPLEMNVTIHEPISFDRANYASANDGSQEATEQVESFFRNKLGYE
jgi:1-acyl-sn-glycerol-3-phosphate acyltransferase